MYQLCQAKKELPPQWLAAFNAFSTKGTVCHTKEQVYDREKMLLEW